MALDDRQENKLQDLMMLLDELSTATDVDGNIEILGALYDLSAKIYERYPELDVEEGEDQA